MDRLTIERRDAALGKQNEMVARNNFITNKIILVFAMALSGSMGLLFISKGLDHVDYFIGTYYFIFVLGFTGIAGVILGVVKEILDRKSKRDLTYKVITGHSIAICSAVVAVSAFLILFGNYSSVIRLLYIAIPALAVLYLIYRLFQREFCILSTIGGLLALYLWRYAQLYKSTPGFALMQGVLISLLLVFAAFLYLIKVNGGKLIFGRQKLQLFGKDTEYAASFVFLAGYVSIVLAAFIVSGSMMFYLAFATVALIFIMAIYFAVRLM